MATTRSLSLDDRFAVLIRGEAINWSEFGMAPAAFVNACRDRELTGLVYERVLGQAAGDDDWPQEVRVGLARETWRQTATELLRREEIVSVLAALAAEEIDAILLKGTALAYGLYDSPAARPRLDTDLLIRRDQVDRTRAAMARLGYTAPVQCEGDLLFCQFCLQKTDRSGHGHIFDFHWKLSTQSVFADVLSYDDVAASAIALPALGPHARSPGAIHALLLACIHPVMHHRNPESLIWTYDVHLLASRLSSSEFDAFAELAVARRMSAVCAHQLIGAHRWFGTAIPSAIMATLQATGHLEPSAAYLRPGRQWRDELISSVRGLPRWRDRLRLLREVALPTPTYMLKAYGLRPGSWSAALLPALYLHRLSIGGWKAVAGQK